ncbi:hypothetical protein WA026_019672 [Henosepilachna vigintioctopunctata]|uniref:Dicer-2 n=1 Tax=Henosepilachna vigintioctopunctata TaxID=420089 RepID=A0AAW1UQ91_9CUCU
MDYMQTILGYINVRLERAMKICTTEKERFWKFSSPKVLTLVSILKKFKETSKEELCGLVFVQRRFTAKIVYHILDALSKCDPDYSSIRSNFIIGNNNNPLCNTRESLYYSKKNRQVLDEFVKKETNLLCTSQVLEEGVDIPKCTLVCKFDLPNDYRSYIQSKGRARHKESQYYIMIPEDQRYKFENHYTQFQLIEHTLNDFLIGRNDVRDGPSKENIEDMYNEQLIPPYYVSGPESAYVNAISAISLLCRYCQNLPRDRYTSCNPEWYLEKVEDPEGISYVVTILLPTLCPIIEPIQGIPMRRKKTAKRAAALQACILLHQAGELTDSLIPAERIIQEEDISFLFEHYPKVKEEGAGTKKIRMHNIQIPDATLGPLLPSHGSYLHIVNLTPLFARDKLDIGKQTVYDMYVSNMCFGILTPNRFPPVFSFPIYVTDGTIMVSIANNVKMVKLTNVELEKIREFHFIVFNDILELLNSFLITDCSDRAESMILVPVLKDELRIDFDVIEKHRSVRSIDCTLKHSEKLALVVNDDTFKHKIVVPPYRKDMPVYLVTEVCYGMTPQSNFPNEDFANFIEYYRKVHQENIVNRDQPLLYVKRLSQKINLFKPSGFEKGKKRQKTNEEYQEYLIPEMLVKQEFPAVLWIQARFLPSILSRVSYVLRVEKLWQRIGIECGFLLNTTSMKLLELNTNLIKYEAIINEKELNAQTRKYYEKSEGMPALLSSLKSSCNKDFQAKLLESRYPWKDLEEPKDINRTLDVTVMDIEAYENFINHKVVGEERQAVHKSPLKIKFPALTYDTPFKQRSIGILSEKLNGKVELADIYEALTTAKANDIVNLERLETLGDSFLKYIASFYILMRFPQYDEGRATQLKGRLISNKNLFYLAQKLQLGGIMKNSDLIATKEWLPPGFCVPEQLQDGIKDKKVSVYSLFKCDFSREEIISGAVKESFLRSIMIDNPLNEVDDNVYQNRQFLKQQCLKDKCVADVVEAILGTYLLNTGIAGCLKVIEWIGIIPKSENVADYFKRQVVDPVIKPNATMDDIIFHLPLYHEIEKIIGYEFKNKGFLVQAFTHASYSPNRATRSYEKLEFLGDAVLDFLITCFIYESCGYLSPGELTDLRSALVNNNTFASFVVRLGLQKFLLMMNSTLQSHVDRFVDFMTEKNFEIDDEVLILLEENDMKLAEYIDVPKVRVEIKFNFCRCRVLKLYRT